MISPEFNNAFPEWKNLRLCHRRKLLGLCQHELAEIIGVATATVSLIERGAGRKNKFNLDTMRDMDSALFFLEKLDYPNTKENWAIVIRKKWKGGGRELVSISKETK